MHERPSLLAVATAVPPNVIDQIRAAELSRGIFSGRYEDYERMGRVFQTTGILKRHFALPIEFYLARQGWPDRTSAYLIAAQDLFVASATAAIARAGLAPSDVDIVVTISSTGIATPSLEARVMERMGLRADVARVPVFGLGCAGGVTGLSIAARLAKAEPGKNVLAVAVEICSVAFRPDQLTKANIVATALFADGAAACVLRAGDSCRDEGMVEIEGAGEHTWPKTLDIMGWQVDPQGFGVIFDRAIPPFARENVGPAIANILARIGISRSDVGRFICHPGGAKVIEALELALSLDQGTLDLERSVLADYGNMSSPTVLFVLDRAFERGLPERSVMTAMGPGFSTSCLSLKKAA